MIQSCVSGEFVKVGFVQQRKMEKETNWWERLGRAGDLLRMAGGRGAAAFCGYRVILGDKASQ